MLVAVAVEAIVTRPGGFSDCASCTLVYALWGGEGSVTEKSWPKPSQPKPTHPKQPTPNLLTQNLLNLRPLFGRPERRVLEERQGARPVTRLLLKQDLHQTSHICRQRRGERRVPPTTNPHDQTWQRVSLQQEQREEAA